MSNTITLTINTTLPQVFSGNAFSAQVSIPSIPILINIPFSPSLNDISASSTVALILPPGGPYVLEVTVPPMAFLNPDSPDLASFSLTFGDTPPTTTPPQNFGFDINDNFFGTVTTLIACLHGSSLINTKDGLKRIDRIKSNDEVLTADNQYAKVINVAHCWLTFSGVNHDAIIFEPGSLGDNEPSQRLIIDPGHPMCTRKEYLEKGEQALRPAGTYWEELKGDGLESGRVQILTKKWTDTFVQEEPSRRYDLILEEPFNTYIANGIVVRSKGYRSHSYKEFI